MSNHESHGILRLAEETLKHLEQERALMLEMSAQAASLHSCLLRRDSAGMQLEVDKLKPLNEQALQRRAYREHLMQALAIRLAVPPEQATLRRLARAVESPIAARLLQLRNELFGLARQVNRQHQSNLTIARSFAIIGDRLIESLTGRASLKRYAKSGQLASSQTGPMFQTDV